MGNVYRSKGHEETIRMLDQWEWEAKVRKELDSQMQNKRVEITEEEIQKLRKLLGESPSGKDVINLITAVKSSYPNAFVTGATLATGLDLDNNDLSQRLGKINQVNISGNSVSVSGGIEIDIGILDLEITDRATITIGTLNSNIAVFDVVGVKAGWFKLSKIVVEPSSITITVGGIPTTWDL